MGRSNAAKSVPGIPFGTQGHKGGRPLGSKGIVQQIRELTDDGKKITGTFWEMANNPKTPAAVRAKCLEWLGERFYGKAPDISLTGDLSESERANAAANLADTELEALARALHASPSTPDSSNPLKVLDKPTD